MGVIDIVLILIFLLFIIIELQGPNIEGIPFIISSVITFVLYRLMLALGIDGWILYVSVINIFIIIIVISYIKIIPILKKTLFYNNEERTVMSERIIDKEGIVIKTIEKFSKGRIKVLGQEWAAKSLNEVEIKIDSTVIVRDVQGVTAIVEEKNS